MAVKNRTRDMSIAILVAGIIAIMALYYAYRYCHLGKYSWKGCPNNAGSGFCGGVPDPAAASEAKALYQLGVRAGSERFSGGCGRASPAAVAESQALMQTGWRPEHLQARPPCGGLAPAALAPAALAEAHGLQKAHGLHPGDPYYTTGAVTEMGLISSLGGGHEDYEVDEFAARQLGRDKASYGSVRDRSEQLRSNPAQTTARHARLDSMREGFSGDYTSDAVGSGGHGGSYEDCVDGCNGTHCEALCGLA
jgi:hypothetical protein